MKISPIPQLLLGALALAACQGSAEPTITEEAHSEVTEESSELGTDTAAVEVEPAALPEIRYYLISPG